MQRDIVAPFLAQHRIGRGAQILGRIEQGSVQIEQHHARDTSPLPFKERVGVRMVFALARRRCGANTILTPTRRRADLVGPARDRRRSRASSRHHAITQRMA